MNRLFRVGPLGFAILFLALLLPIAGCDSEVGPTDTADVDVMTYNLYLGAEIFALVGTPAEELPAVAGQLFADVQATDFPARAEAIADIIEQENPDLIGLQEVTLYRTQTPADNLPDEIDQMPSTPATDVAFDFLQILQDALDARGLDYRVAATTTNADVEIPSTTDGATFTDIRLTDRDVILARNDVETANPVEANFATAAPVPVGDVAVPFTRGYNSVRATVDGVSFTFANAHLEVDDGNPEGAALVQVAQGLELVSALASAPSPVVLVGDFNSAADGSGTQVTLTEPITFSGTTYDLLTGTYTDAAEEEGVTDDTCCQAADLLNATSSLTSRIDLILYRGDVEPLSAEVVGDERVDLGGPQWPSDHAGVVAKLRVAN
jgi:endonuclease/exonuclease/phosphatase family metal-dependent hydrolase